MSLVSRPAVAAVAAKAIQRLALLAGPRVAASSHGTFPEFPRDPLCRHLAATAGVVVANVDYAVAPQHRFPAPPRQVYEVVRWIAGPAIALQVLHYPLLDFSVAAGKKPLSAEPTLVVTAELDLLRAEGIRYAQRIQLAGVLVEHHDVAGADHGYDVKDTEKAREVYALIARRVREATDAVH
jgi:acetyl esterase